MYSGAFVRIQGRSRGVAVSFHDISGASQSVPVSFCAFKSVLGGLRGFSSVSESFKCVKGLKGVSGAFRGFPGVFRGVSWCFRDVSECFSGF